MPEKVFLATFISNRTSMKTGIFMPKGYAVLIILLLTACTKNSLDKGLNCDEINTLQITGSKTSYYAGDTINLTSSTMPYGLFSWRHDSISTNLSNKPSLFIYPSTKYDEGWYYITVSDVACGSHTDSVYLKVINKPVTAPCNPPNNTVSFSAIPDISFNTTSWALNLKSNCMSLQGYRAINYPDINIYFNPYWNTKEPEDGAYNTSSTLDFPGKDVYTVFVATTYSGVYFQANQGKVYVSHAGGKLQVTFCDLPMLGNFDGASYMMTAKGKLTAP